jgi:glucose/arabinose dehydrogenase
MSFKNGSFIFKAPLKSSMFPSRDLHQSFNTEQGSWNWSVPIGHRITTMGFEKQVPVRYEIFAEGWLQGDRGWRKPVDVRVLKYGSLMVSDDRTGVVYRITMTNLRRDRPAKNKGIPSRDSVRSGKRNIEGV